MSQLMQRAMNWGSWKARPYSFQLILLQKGEEEAESPAGQERQPRELICHHQCPRNMFWALEWSRGAQHQRKRVSILLPCVCLPEQRSSCTSQLRAEDGHKMT